MSTTDPVTIDPVEHHASGLVFPLWIGSFRLEGTDDYEADSPGLGLGLRYNAPGVKATIYVFNLGNTDIPDGADSDEVGQTFISAVRDVARMAESGAYDNAKVAEPWRTETPPGSSSLPFLATELRYRETESDIESSSFIWVTAVHGHFFKIRLTGHDSLIQSRAGKELKIEFVSAIAMLLASSRCDAPLAEFSATVQAIADCEPRLNALIASIYNLELPVSGGWGYTAGAPVVLEGLAEPTWSCETVFLLEHVIIERRTWIEFITLADADERLSGIRWNTISDELIDYDGTTLHRLVMEITGLKDADFEALKAEYESPTGHGRPEFDEAAHWAKNESKIVRHRRTFWFRLGDRAPVH